MPSVELVAPESDGQLHHQGASGRKKAADEGHDKQSCSREAECLMLLQEVSERQAVLEHVLTGLNEELITELFAEFHGPKDECRHELVT